jgi:retron-type reverse transcriptase
MLRERIDDTAFLDLIRKWLKAGVLDRNSKVIYPESGTPQGGIVSPVLANIYLHFGLDLWFERKVKLNYNVPGNLSALWRFYSWAEACAFKWLNRRGGKRKSFTLKIFTKAIDLLGIAKPKMRIVNRQHCVFT